MPEITKSRVKLDAWAVSRARDQRALELIAEGMEPEAAWVRAFDEAEVVECKGDDVHNSRKRQTHAPVVR